MPPYAETAVVVSPDTTMPLSAPAIVRKPPASLLAASSVSSPAASAKSSVAATEPSVGAPVLTAFGLGTIIDKTSSNKMLTIELSSWKLANQSTVVCHLRRSDVTILSSVAVENMSVQQKIQYAKLCKDLGVGAQQNGKLPGTALLLHQAALETTQAVLKDCDSQDRPNLFLTMVKGHNHAAGCALQLDLYRKARDHAKNSIAVLDALEKKGQQQQQQQQAQSPQNSPSSASTASSFSTSSTSSSDDDSAATVGKVKLFGECRCKALIYVARSYLENPKCKQRHRDLAKTSLDEASAVIKKYSTKEYTQMPEMKVVLRQFVGHKRNITKYRQIAKQQLPTSVASSGSQADNNSYSAWFANKRVWFADDAAKNKKNSRSSSKSDKTMAETALPPAAWSQKAASAIALTGFVALGAFMVHQVVAANRRK